MGKGHGSKATLPKAGVACSDPCGGTDMRVLHGLRCLTFLLRLILDTPESRDRVAEQRYQAVLAVISD